MAIDLEILTPDDKPALIGATSPEVIEAGRTALIELGYKVHSASDHENFSSRFGQVQYQVVILEETFGGVSPDQNTALRTLQGMNMAQRRHATIILVGNGFETLHALQAFQQSVHAVVKNSDVEKLKPILQQVINDQALFLSVFRDVQGQISKGKK